MGGSTFAEVSLDEIADFRNGKAISPEKYTPVGRHPVFGSNGQIASSDDVLYPEPAIVIGRVGAYCGCVHYVPRASWVTDNAIVALPKDGNDIRFLYYLLGSLELQRTAIGSAQPLMTQGGLKVVRTKTPPLAEQKAIAAVLGALDDKIELNRRMNATLEAMARALFQSWFVDFDPVRAKLDGRKPVGLDEANAALFPDAFQNSTSGHIPNGWTFGTVGDLLTLCRDAINPGNFPNESFDHFSLPAFDNGRIPKVEHGNAIMSSKFVVTPNSVLLSKLNPHIPRIWLPNLHTARRAVCSTEFIVACSKPGVSREYLFSLFTNSVFASVYGTLVTGTTGSHQRIRPESVLEIKIVAPPPSLISAFTASAKPMFDQINRNIDQSCTLGHLRDTLLPKLLSGEVSVCEVGASVALST